MKKTILLSAALFCGSLTASAQEYLIVDADTYIPVAEIDSITYKDYDVASNVVSGIMAKDDNISLFNEALALTQFDKVLKQYQDYNYTVGADSVDWTNPNLVKHIAAEYDNVAYPKQRLKKFTAFVETDDVYKAAGINNIADLKAYAKQIYDEVYPEDANITDPTDRRNSLNRFVAYHFLNRYGSYYTLTAVDGAGSELAKNWNRSKWDIADWYETMMPHSIMKLSFPSGAEQGLYINRRGVQSGPDGRGVQIRGAMITPPYNMTVEQTSINGIYHYIDEIIHYGKTTQEVVLDERMRIDASTLSPDFMNSGARGCMTRSSNYGGMYGTYDGNSSISNRNTCYGFKGDYLENFSYSDSETHLHLRPRTLSFWSYQGDEVIIKGNYDVTIKLPSLPKGTYELRLGTCIGFNSRGVTQFYLDGVACGAPVDFSLFGSDPSIGWESDSWMGSDEEIAQLDKDLRSRGWMKGPASYTTGRSESEGGGGSYFRDIDRTLRKIITQFTSDGKTDHYLRIKLAVEKDDADFNLDYIELCPSTVYNNEQYPEDIY